MRKNHDDYYAYLLRFWRKDGRDAWYATLQNPHSGELLKFANLEQLWEFIQQQTQPISGTQQKID